ncbi:hypothetical protein Tco_0094739 [Tanacetum coccineum]
MLYRDRRAHACTALLAMDASDLTRLEVMSLRTTVFGQQTQMTEFESQQGPAKCPTQPDAPEEAGSS